MQNEELTRLEKDDVVARAERARQALVSAVERFPAGDFLVERPPEWSAGRSLRHLVWVEYYWTLTLQHVARATSALVEIDDDANAQIAREAARRAATPWSPPLPYPPYVAKPEALTGLEASRSEYLSAIQSLGPADFAKRMSRRGVVPLRFLIEHVIQHDWDHAVQLTGLRCGPSPQRDGSGGAVAPPVDLTGIETPRSSSPELEEILDAFVRGCLAVFGDERVEAIVFHGSAAKGGFIAGFSDVDLMVLLKSECFDEFGLGLDYAFAIHERIASLAWDRAAARYPQVYFYDQRRMPDWWTGPVPSASLVLYGAFPQRLRPTSDGMRVAALHLLRDELPNLIRNDAESLADSADRDLPRRLRLLSTRVTPALFSLLVLRSEDPLGEWARTKQEAAEVLTEEYPGVGDAALPRQFYRSLPALYGQQFDVELARRTYRMGLEFLIWAHRTARAGGRT